MGSAAARKVGGRIRAERDRLGLSQMDFAHLAGMNVANVGRIERGEGNPSLETLVGLARVLDVRLAELVSDVSGDDVQAGRGRYTAAEFIRERESRQG
jgi:transcriptional regulator with XRE-family HTH domain